MGYALSLFGRQQDRLSHVLVSEDFEGNPHFYYPTRDGNIIFDTRNGKNKALDPAKAKVILADIPFLRINNDEAKNTMNGFSFTDTINATQEALKPADLIINRKQQLLEMNTRKVKLQDQRFAFYCWIIDKQLNNDPLLSPVKDEKNITKDTRFKLASEFLAFYEKVKGEMGATEKTEKAFENGMTKDYVSSTVTRINDDIKSQLGSIASTPFLVKKRRGPSYPYLISVTLENIIFKL
jgi:hypothetical protein